MRRADAAGVGAELSNIAMEASIEIYAHLADIIGGILGGGRRWYSVISHRDAPKVNPE